MTDETTTQAAPSAPAETETDQTVDLNAVETATETKTPEETTAPPDQTTTQAEGEEPDAGETDDQGQKKKPTGSQRLKRRLSLVEAEFLDLQRQNEELRQRVEAPAPSKDGKPGIDREPTEADFPNDYFAYQEARSAWTAQQAVERIFARREQAAQRSNQDRVQAEYRAERVEALHDLAEVARERIPDFDKVVNTATSVPVSPDLADEILASDKSALLQYHLAKNPDKVKELNGLRGRELAREIGRLEARVHLPTPKKATQAEPPPSQPKGGSAPPVNLETADMETYVALRRKQMAKA